MAFGFGKGLRDILHVSPEEGTHVADAAEELVPGGAGVVQWLVRSKREVLRGVAAVIDAHVKDLEDIDEALSDKDREPRAHAVNKSLLAYPAKRALAVHTLVSQTQNAILRGVVASLSDPEPDDQGPVEPPPPSMRSNKITIE